MAMDCIEKRFKYLFFITLLSAIFFVNNFANADQLKADRAIQTNKMFIHFMDISITNLGDKYKEEFKQIYQIHFNGEIAYLQSDYNRSFKNIYQSQIKQANLYSRLVLDYIEQTKLFLDSISPEVIKSKSKKAKLYLNLAYRDSEIARNHHKIADASNPKLCSNRIYRYIEAIKILRRARRYAFLAIYESQDVDTKKAIFNHLFEMEREKGNPFYNRFISKDEKGIVEEMKKEYYEYNQNQKGTNADLKNDKYEKRLEKKIRFKDEKKVAEYLLLGEFDKAEPIIIDYIDDYSYKLLQATIEYLKVKQFPIVNSLGVENLKLYLKDSYNRYAKASYLESIVGELKVVDNIENLNGKKKDNNKIENNANNEINKNEKEKKEENNLN